MNRQKITTGHVAFGILASQGCRDSRKRVSKFIFRSSADKYSTNGDRGRAKTRNVDAALAFRAVSTRIDCRGGSLLPWNSFDIMRPHSRIAVVGVALLGLARPSAALGSEAPDSVDWLPGPAAESEAPDRLAEFDPVRGFMFRADLRRGRMAARAAAAEGRLPRWGNPRASWLARGDGRGRLSLAIASTARSLVVGSFVGREGGPLFQESLELARPIRAPASPRAGGVRIEPPRGSSSPTVRGAAVSLRSARGGLWALGGRNESSDRLAGLGIWGERGTVRASLSSGVLRRRDPNGSEGPERRVGAVALRRAVSDWTAGGELLVSPTRGPELLAEASGQAEALRVVARWRKRPGEKGPVAGVLLAETQARWGRLRAQYQPWSSRALDDDGRLELEAGWRMHDAGACRVRIGGSSAERHVVADAVIAREGGRSFTLLASRRESRGLGRGAVGSTIGGRLEVASRARTGFTILAQATRAGLSPRAAAWGEGLTVSGERTLVERSRSGISVSGRGWLQVGALRLDAMLADVDPATGGRPAGASVWLSWSRTESR
jgi:hypothetical protein